MACQEGVEPPTACLEGRCSIQLSYWQRSKEFNGFAPPRGANAHARQRDSHKALSTTLTELKAIAAPASIGLSPPAIASGIPMTL